MRAVRSVDRSACMFSRGMRSTMVGNGGGAVQGEGVRLDSRLYSIFPLETNVKIL